MFTANIVPGQGFQPFTLYKKKSGLTDSGRPKSGGYVKVQPDCEFYGMLMNASQREIELWKQQDHPISHKVVAYGSMVKGKATDVIRKEDGRTFYVQGVKNPADMNVTFVFYVEERFDIEFEVNE